MNRNLQILGLTKKAGLLAVGAEDTYCAARAGKVQVVISACDASERSLRRARGSAEMCRVPHVVVPYTSFELGSVSGRGSPGTVAILDMGLAARFIRGMAETEPESYSEPAKILTQKARARTEKRRHALSGKRRTVQ